MRGWRALVAATLVALSACSLFTDLGGFYNPTADGGPGPVAPVSDASLDALGNVPLDAGTDAGCSGDFCDDFDDGPLGATWTETRLANGKLEHDVTSFLSPPHGFRSSVKANPGSGTAYIERTVGFRPKSIHCTFRVHPNAPYGPSDITDFFQVVGTGPNVRQFFAKVGVYLGTEGNVRTDVVYTDGHCDCPLPIGGNFPAVPPVGAWTKVEVSYDFASIIVRFDDKIVHSAPFSLPFEPTDVRVALGLYDYTKQGGDTTYDDLVCRFTR